MNKRESMSSISERIPIRVKEDGKAAILIGDILNVLSITDDLKNGVIIEMFFDPRFTG
jgi:hypothetical protein